MSDCVLWTRSRAHEPCLHWLTNSTGQLHWQKSTIQFVDVCLPAKQTVGQINLAIISVIYNTKTRKNNSWQHSSHSRTYTLNPMYHLWAIIMNHVWRSSNTFFTQTLPQIYTPCVSKNRLMALRVNIHTIKSDRTMSCSVNTITTMCVCR